MREPPDEKGRPLQGRPHASPWQEMQPDSYSEGIADASLLAARCNQRFGFLAGLHDWVRRHPEYAHHPLISMMRGDAYEGFSVDYAALPSMGSAR